MDVSIITPFYKGEKFLNQYISNMYKVLDVTNAKYRVEILIINDSPEVEVKISEEDKKNLNIKIINNEKNIGIHLSRIKGYNNSGGRYVIFLDQDDDISPNIINIFLNEIDDNDMCVANGFFEFKNDRYLIFGNYKSGKYSVTEKKYIYIRDFIASPGQCLIKKTSIPEEWIKNPLEINGTDDYFLWLLMFDKKCKMKYIHETLYTHKDTGNNLSLNLEKMNASTICMLNKLKDSNYDINKFRKLSKTIEFKTNLKKKKYYKIMFHPYIFVYNLLYRLFWKGYLVKK